MASSKKYAQGQVQSILNAGAAQYNLAQENAAMTINKGRAGMIAGIMQGMSTEAGAAEKFTLSNNTQGNAMTLAAGTLPSNTSPFSKPSFQ